MVKKLVPKALVVMYREYAYLFLYPLPYFFPTSTLLACLNTHPNLEEAFLKN